MDQRRLDRELRELNDDYFDTWITVEQDQDQDQIHAQMLAEIEGQDTRDQDTSNQDAGDQDTVIRILGLKSVDIQVKRLILRILQSVDIL
jgi:hypothetical protein